MKYRRKWNWKAGENVGLIEINTRVENNWKLLLRHKIMHVGLADNHYSRQ